MRLILYIIFLIPLEIVCQSNTNIYGVFSCYKSLVFNGTSQQPIQKNSVIAYFTYTAIPVINPENFEKAGNVKINNKPLDYNNNSLFYSDNSEDVDLTQMNWKVSGHKTIPNMNFIYNGVFPVFNSTVILPDTISKSDTLVIPINGVSDGDSIIVNLWDKDSQGANRKYLEFKFPNTADVIYILPEWISSLTLGNRSYLSVEIVNYKYQTVSNLNFLFKNYRSIIKPNILITN